MPEAKTPGQTGAPEYKCPETERLQEWPGSAASMPGIPKEGALTYTDWRLEVEEYIMKKYPRPKIKEAMFYLPGRQG